MLLSEVQTIKQLADLLGIKLSTLTYLLYGKGIDNCYSKFYLTKKSGGEREICAPNKTLKIIQRKLLELIKLQEKEYYIKRRISRKISHGFEEGKSILTNANAHKRKKYTFNVDLENFFETLHFGRVRGLFF